MKGSSTRHVNLDEARKSLDELVDLAVAGETIVIERGDGASVRIGPDAPSTRVAKADYDWDEHWKWLEQQPLDQRPQQEAIDEWRGRERY